MAKARTALQEAGFVRMTHLGPPALRRGIAAELAREGYEITKTVVRRPVVTQLRERLAAGELIAMKTLRAPAGASVAEARRVALELVREGKAHLVMRAQGATLMAAQADALSRDELRAARDVVVELGKRLQSLTKRGALATMLRADLAAAWTALAGDPSVGSSARVSSSPLAPCGAERGAVDAPAHAAARTEPAHAAGWSEPARAVGWSEEHARQLLRAVDGARDDRMGLSFVPRIVRALAPEWDLQAAHALLLEACRRGLVELRPESGLGRLSEEELRACPPGPQGTRLSWARRLG